jgi:hypothetical protein
VLHRASGPLSNRCPLVGQLSDGQRDRPQIIGDRGDTLAGRAANDVDLGGRQKRALGGAMSAFPPKADMCGATGDVRLEPCVDGAELARAFFTFAALVGAAMCSAFECGTQGRWP